MSLHPHPTYYAGQCLEYCHDDMHVDGDSCPTCQGWRTGCAACTPDHIKAKRHAEAMRARQTPSGTTSAKAGPTHPSVPEDGAPGREVEPRSPATPSRPDAHQRVTSTLPLAVEQDVHDTDWTVTVGLTDDAARQHVRDLYRHRADLLTYFRMRMQAEERHAGPSYQQAAREAENRAAGALQSMATTQWVLTPAQAEALQQQLEDAQADPVECAVGTCSAYAVAGGSYCAPHDERG